MGSETAGAISLSMADLAIATSLVLVAGVVSMALRLGLGRTLLLASVRTVAQLLIIGFILEWIFSLEDAIPLFCVTARTCNPNELFCNNVQTKTTTKITKIMIAIRLNGRTTPLKA